MPPKDIKVHLSPVWADKVNATLLAAITWPDDDIGYERLPARAVRGTRFEICCIPFFAYNINLGDIVGTVLSAESERVVVRVDKHGGHYSYRVWLGDTDEETKKAWHDSAEHDLPSLGCELEVYSTNLHGLDAPSYSAAERLVEWMKYWATQGVEWEAINDA